MGRSDKENIARGASELRVGGPLGARSIAVGTIEGTSLDLAVWERPGAVGLPRGFPRLPVAKGGCCSQGLFRTCPSLNHLGHGILRDVHDLAVGLVGIQTSRIGHPKLARDMFFHGTRDKFNPVIRSPLRCSDFVPPTLKAVTLVTERPRALGLP